MEKICIIGWYYPRRFYKQLKESKLDVYIVGHRYNKILDELNFDYTITKNIGLEWGAYDWYIKNKWNKKSNVLFMHDDVRIKRVGTLFNILKECKNYDRVYVLGHEHNSKNMASTRCFYLSSRIIKILMKRYGGLLYDTNNRGYTVGKKRIYNKKYSNKAYAIDTASIFKNRIKKIVDEYGLLTKKISRTDIYLFRRGGKDMPDKNNLNDNSIFVREIDNPLDKIVCKAENNRCRKEHYYSKWYNFYFSSLRLDNLNILEIGIKRENSLDIWKEYFKNSTIYGIKENKVSIGKKIIKNPNIFIGDQFDKEFLESVSLKVPQNFDIIINSNQDNQLKSFDFLFKRLNPFGIYVIENLQSSFEILNYLKNRIDDVNFHGKFKKNNIENININKLGKYEKSISGINFHPGICFIFKRF